MLRCGYCNSEAVMPKSGLCLACDSVNTSLIQSVNEDKNEDKVVKPIGNGNTAVNAVKKEVTDIEESIETYTANTKKRLQADTRRQVEVELMSESSQFFEDSDETNSSNDPVEDDVQPNLNWMTTEWTHSESDNQENKFNQQDVEIKPKQVDIKTEKISNNLEETQHNRVDSAVNDALITKVDTQLKEVDARLDARLQAYEEKLAIQQKEIESARINERLLTQKEPTIRSKSSAFIEQIELPQEANTKARLQQSYKKVVNSCSHELEKLKGGLISGNSQKQNSFMLTSTNRGEGVTTSALATAVALSRYGNSSVLLIDANAANPKLHALFSVKDCAGFAEYITSDVETMDTQNNRDSASSIFQAMSDAPNEDQLSWAKCTYFTEYNGFYLMPYSTNKGACSLWDLVEHKEFNVRLETLKQMFDYVVFDASAIMGSSEAILLSQYVDGVVLVVGAEQTKWEVAEIATNTVRQAGGIFVGSILNKRKFYIPKMLYGWV